MFTLAFQGPNLALGKPAWQTSTLNIPPFSTNASNAVDGNADGDLFADSCTCTASVQAWPWWALDLVAVTAVKAVMITNRVDYCCKILF